MAEHEQELFDHEIEHGRWESEGGLSLPVLGEKKISPQSLTERVQEPVTPVDPEPEER